MRRKSVSKPLSESFKRLAKFPFIFILILLEIYFLINGAAHFADWDATYGQLIMIYLLMTIVFLFWSTKETQERVKVPLKNAAVPFFMFFVLTYIALLCLSLVGIIKAYPLPKELFWQTVIIQVCVVATAEELMFRGVLLDLTGIVISSALFAFWHAYSYGVIYYALSWETLNWGGLLFAFIMGIIFALIARKKEWGLPGAIASHAAYNITITGAFATFNML